jgi:hypothetical protein
MGRSGCCPENHSVAFGNKIINCVVGIRKSLDKSSFEALQLDTIHRREPA